jgi:hypothetical protein
MRTLLPLIGAAALAANVLLAATFPTEWKNVQPVRVDQIGLVKLSVPLESLDAARAGLEDLRLYDDAGREIPFHLERPVQAQRIVQPAKRFQVTLANDATSITLETGLDRAINGLTLETPAREFVKAARVEGSSDGDAWQTIAQGQPLFRQPDGASNLRLAFAPAAWAWLRVTLDDRRSAPIAWIGAQVHAAAREQAPAEPLGLRMVEREESPGQTRLLLQAAGAHVTLAGLDLDTSTPLFTRRVSLAYRGYAENEVREIILTRDTLYRTTAAAQSETSNLTFAVDVPIPTRELILTIQNGDSPPLPVTAIQARRRPVYLVWLATQPGTYHLLTGNALCAAPQYDVAALSAGAAALVILRAPAPLGDNPGYHPAEPVPEILDTGAAIDLSRWTYRQRVDLSQPGVQQLELDVDVLSRANTALDDLRLVHRGQQQPFLFERAAFSRSLAPEVQKADDPKRRTISRWLLRLPRASLPVTRLTCETDAPFFQRDATLREEVRDERGNLYWVNRGAAVWVRSLNQKKETLQIILAGRLTTDQLALEFDNGDNPPLALRNFKIDYPVTRLLFKASPGEETFLYYGNPAAGFPRYDIAFVAPRLLAAGKNRAALGTVENLKHSAWSDAERFHGAAGWLFWGVLGVVVVALLILVARLLPKQPA